MMTAPPPEPSPIPDWFIPPPEGFTAEDLDRLPRLPPHTQLLDGGLVLRSPQSDVHMLAVSLLVDGLRRTAPAEVLVRREMSVILGPRQRPEPDIVVIRSDADPGPKRTAYRPADVLLAVEVVSPDSEERDRRRKPQLYAEAGIPHFWRVENNSRRPTVYVYELDPATRAYALTGSTTTGESRHRVLSRKSRGTGHGQTA
jgi:Uma2 family endonuclease